MTPLKIKITVRDCALEMQVLERNWSGEWSNDDMKLVSADYACPIFEQFGSIVWVGDAPGRSHGTTHFTCNLDRDAYLSRVKRLIHDFHVAWKAGEVEVLR